MKGRFYTLLLSLIALIILLPLLEREETLKLVKIAALVSLIPIFSLLSFSKNGKIMRSLLFLAVPVLVFDWGAVFSDRVELFILSGVFSILFYLYLVYIIFQYITKAKKVDENVILGAICMYILLGLAWGSAYFLLDTVLQDSFSGELLRSNFIYYSLVTLTTVGYGDILPQSPLAKSIASLEAVSGVMFSTIFLAKLVSLYGQERK